MEKIHRIMPPILLRLLIMFSTHTKKQRTNPNEPNFHGLASQVLLICASFSSLFDGNRPQGQDKDSAKRAKVLDKLQTLQTMQNFRVQCCPELGRYAIANCNLYAGDVVVDELPFVNGPKQNTQPVCLGCYRFVDGSQSGPKCDKCSWPLCENCDPTEHHKNECEIFAQANAKFQSLSEPNMICLQLDCITPLRFLLKKETDPEAWEKYIEPMEYHDTSRRARKDIWNADLINIAKYLRGPCKLNRFSEELIMRAVGVLEVNAFEAITKNGSSIRCLYPLSAILAHNCVPNVFKSIYPSDNLRMKLRAMTEIKEHQQLCTTYTYTFDGTQTRQACLKSGKYFTCHCSRCLDPTELGTHFSSLKCLKCQDAYVISNDPLDETADWKCQQCEYTTSAVNVKTVVTTMQDQVNELPSEVHSKEYIKKTEALCKKFTSFLHPSHYILISLYQKLINIYGRVDNFKLENLPLKLPEHKKKFCLYILSLLDVFEPGLSKFRAAILYEICGPMVVSAKIALDSRTLTDLEYEQEINKTKSLLEECITTLQYSDLESQEGTLLILAKKALGELKLQDTTTIQ